MTEELKRVEADPEDLILVPHVISAVDAASLAAQVGLYRITHSNLCGITTYLVDPKGGFHAIIETYQKAKSILKGDING